MVTLTRRSVITGGAALAAAGLPSLAARADADSGGASPASIELTVNGRTRALNVDVRMTLLDALREELQLTGSKKGCDHGQCGACTVHIDGTRVLACLTLVMAAQGKRIGTIEGLAGPDGTLHPMQRAFIDQDGFQCGYCTPGQIMSAIGCVHEGHAHSDDEIRESMSGNLCRCGAYPNIVAAIKQAREAMGDVMGDGAMGSG